MSVKWKTKSNKFPEMERAIAELNGKKVQVGVLGGGEQAWLASIHEYGCRIAVTDKMRKYLAATGLHLKATTTEIVIPERSFLRTGYDESKDKVLNDTSQLIDDVIGGAMSVDQFLKIVGVTMSSKIKDYARDLDDPPNHSYTIERKGSSNPLVDTGGMIGAITYRVE